MSNKVKFICKACGQIFCDYKSSRRKFCCVDCKNEYNLKKYVERTCKQCGASFFIRKTSLKTNASGNFCCRLCYNQFQATLTKESNNHSTGKWLSCDECHKSIWVRRYKRQSNKNNFCSIKCRSRFHSKNNSGSANSNWRGGHQNYRGDFEHIKRLYFNDKLLFCAICGRLKNLHIHHIIPYRYTKDNSLSNLIPLCSRCHKWFENITWKIIDEHHDLSFAKMMLNGILRERQLATYEFVKKVAREVKDESR